MKKINDLAMLDNYIAKHHIAEFFSQDITPYMELFLFKRNEYICREDESIYYLFFLVDGKAKVFTTLSNGKSLLLCFYGPLQLLGDVEMIKVQNATSNVQIIEDTYCIGIPLAKVRELLLDDAKFLRFICDSLGGKLNRCSKNSSINLLYPLENRIASYILATGVTVKSNGKSIMVFDENLTQIAELLGTSYRHLLRTLNTLCSKGAMVKKDTYYEVTNEPILKSLAADLYK